MPPKPFATATFLGVCLIVACGGPDATRSVDDRIRSGDAYLANGELARSRAEFEAALAREPERPALHVRLGRVHAAAGRFARAATEFRHVLARDPASADAWAAWGDALAAEGQNAAAVHCWRRAAARAPSTPGLLDRLGVMLARLGRARKAVSVFARARAVDGTPPAAVLAYWGVALQDLGRTAEARTYYAAALQADPREPTALLGLGRLLTATPASIAEATRVLERLANDRPMDADALEALASAYAAAGRLEESHAAVRRALAATPVDGAARRRRLDALAAAEAAVPRAVPSAGMPNVLLVVIDTLRADHVSSYGYTRPTTPNIDRLAGEAVVFERAMSQAPWTAASVATLLTGLYPSVHGIDGGIRWGEHVGGHALPFVAQRTLGASDPTVAAILRRSGYRTGAFVSNVFVNAIFGFGQGFDVYEDDSAEYAEDVMTAKRRGERTNERVFTWLDTRAPEPAFLFVHYNEPHWPYDPPPVFARRWTAGYRGTLTPGTTAFAVENEGRAVPELGADDLAYVVGLYDGEVAHADANLGALLAHIRQQPSTRPWVVVVTADHGEEFLDHRATSHGYTLYEEQLHVPLLIAYPGRLHAARIPALVRLIDVVPTVLDLAGVDRTGVVLQGTSLVPLLDDPTAAGPGDAFAEATLRGALQAIQTADGLKLITRPDAPSLAFDLAHDPGERVDLGGRPEVRALATRLTEWTAANRALRAARHPGAEAPDVVLDDATRRRLRALGYLQ